MRGADAYNEALFSTVRLEDFVPANHPLRPIRTWVNDALAGMDEKLSARRPSERLSYPHQRNGSDLAHLRLDMRPGRSPSLSAELRPRRALMRIDRT